MKLYNRYLSHKITHSFLVTLVTLLFLIWFARAIPFIAFAAEQGIAIADFLNLFVLILPWLLLVIIPISLFVAILIGYNQMLSHNEIVILKNASLNNSKLAKPVIALAVICCLICYSISFFFMPFSNKKLRTIKSSFKSTYANLTINPGMFETFNKMTIYAQGRTENQLTGILIYDNSNSEYSATITAQKGALKQSEQNSNALLLYIDQGTAERFNYKTRKTDILNFDSYVVNLSENNQSENTIKWKAKERYIGELLNPEESSSFLELKKYYIELHQRITYPLLSLILGLIAASEILAGKFSRRGNLFHSLKATILATIFVGLFMLSYNLADYSSQLAPVMYLNLIFFVLLSFYRLRNSK